MSETKRPELHTVSPPEESPQDEPQVREVEDYLTHAYALRERLLFWSSHKKELLSLVLGADRDQAGKWGEEEVSLDDAPVIAQDMSVYIEDVIARLTGLSAGLMKSDLFQHVYEEKLGRRVDSLDEGVKMAKDLLKPWHEKYIKHRADFPSTGKRTRDGLSAQEAAWDVTARAIPTGVDISNDTQLQDLQKYRAQFDEMIEKLLLLPGPHQKYAQAFRDNQGDASNAYGLLHSYAFKKPSRRIERLDLEWDWKKEDLYKLERTLTEAEDLIVSAREQFPDIRIEKPRDAEQCYQEMRELFGEQFLGIEAVEHAFTLQSGEKLLDLLPEQRQEVMRLLREKLEEPDIAQFIEKVKSGEIDKDAWMLVLRVPTISVRQSSEGVDADSVGSALDTATRTGRGTARAERRAVALTMQHMIEYLAPDMRARGQGKLLRSTERYRNEAFYTTQQPGNQDFTPETIITSQGKGQMHWQIVSAEVLSETLGRNHAEQTHLLQEGNHAFGFDEDKARKRTPVEVVQDWFVLLRNGKRTMAVPYRHDWGDVRASGGQLLLVGGGVSDGLVVNGFDARAGHHAVGVSRSR